MYSYEKKKKINWDHAYILLITLIAMMSLLGNYYQNHNYSVVEESYKHDYEVLESTYLELQDEYETVKDQLEIITDEYNELYNSMQ